MPDIEKYTPSQMETEVQSLAEGYVSAVGELEIDTEIFEDISTAIQSKTGQVAPYDKSEMAGAIDGIVADPNANLDAYIQGDLTDIVFNGTQIIREIFNRSPYITSISMPNTEQIGIQSFYYCPNLVSVYWSNSLLTIYPQAFQGCSELNITYFPPYLNNIGNGAFMNCTSIIAIDMSYLVNIPVIGTTAFSNTTCIFLFRDQTQLDAYASATNWSALASRFQIKGE